MKLQKVYGKPEFIAPPKKRGPKSSLDDDEILDLFNQGWSIARIARRMYVVPSTIRYHLRKLREEGKL